MKVVMIQFLFPIVSYYCRKYITILHNVMACETTDRYSIAIYDLCHIRCCGHGLGTRLTRLLP